MAIAMAAVLIGGMLGVICGDYDDVVKPLGAGSEIHESWGKVDGGRGQFEIWTRRRPSADRPPTWTAVQRFPDGSACIIATGTDWHGGNGI